jgi:hypothetical protein
VGEDGIIEAQRDVYPGGGLIATSDVALDETWNNRIAVLIPVGIYAPQTLDVVVGLYDLRSNDRMSASGSEVDPQTNRVRLGRIRLAAPPGDVPNPVNVNFGGKWRLLGYEVSDRSLAPGEQTQITLYWRLERLDTNEVISVQVIDTSTLTKAAQLDAPPAPPTTAWKAGESITDTRTLAIFLDAAPGYNRVMVRVYPADDPAHPLRVRGGSGGQSEDFALLNWMRVE